MSRHRRATARLRCLLPPLVAALAVACGPREAAEPTPTRQSPPEVSVDQRWHRSTDWVDVYRPESSDPGYNLVLYNRRVPLLIDMDGSVAHSWPLVRASGRARLLRSGHLAVIGEDGDLAQFDWEGKEVWRFALPDSETFLHHDFIQLENGNLLLLAHDPEVASDFLLEVDRDGRAVWRWNSQEHLSEDFGRAGERNNKTHVNSLDELPPNRWYERGFEAFRPGNILISARNLNALYIVDRASGEVVWSFFEGLDYQHEALMIPPDRTGAGNILFFNNGYHNLYAFRQSAIVEINPVDRTVVWEYRKRGFYSSTGGTQQSLANGNLLVTSSQGGRVFELTRDGRIVWQWSPPFLPMRASRYPYDYCRRTAELGKPASEAIANREPDRFVDANLYAFALPHETRRVRHQDRTHMVLRDQNRCQILLLPEEAKIQFGYGRWRQDSETPFIGSRARFVATLRDLDSDRSEVLLDRTLGDADGEPQDDVDSIVLFESNASLAAHGSSTVELCLSLSSAKGGPPPEDFVWEEPTIRAPARWARLDLDSEADEAALEQQEKQLKALGYVN